MPKAVALLILLGLGVIPSLSLPTNGLSTGKYFDHSVTILMENNDLQTVLSQGSFEAVHAHEFALSTGYSAIAHPSEPNYVALIGGSTYGIGSDRVCCFTIQATNLVDRLESAGLTWKAFAENSTGSGTCSFNPPRRGDHFPFLDFADINTPSRCSNFVTTTASDDPEFINYLNTSQPANYIWLTPTDTDNGHNSPYIAAGDAYLANLVPIILGTRLFETSKAALFIVYDEGKNVRCTSGGSDCIYASWSGPAVKKGFESDEPYSHYSYLRTIEDNWGLGSLTATDGCSPVMAEFFVGFPSGPAGSCPSSLFFNPLVIGVAIVALGVSSVALLYLRSRRRHSI